MDAETGLYYYGVRYYEPEISLFYGVDRFAEKFANRSGYSYAACNPVKYLDLNGDSTVVNETGLVLYHDTKDNNVYMANGDNRINLEEFALRQAGDYQIKSGTSKPEWQVYETKYIPGPSGPTIIYKRMPPYGDDPRDQHWIREGYSYYKNKLNK